MVEQSHTGPTACRVIYSGQVQGVGFRATAANIARAYPITGWVRNCADGRVELWAEGEASAVHAFLQAIRRQWGAYIRDEQVSEETPTGHYHGFSVTH